jgi:hypothetical protein
MGRSLTRDHSAIGLSVTAVTVGKAFKNVIRHWNITMPSVVMMQG